MTHFRAELLAQHIADALEEPENIGLYQMFTKQYPEDVLRRVLNKVLSIPEKKIRKTRGALFVHLLTKNYSSHAYHRNETTDVEPTDNEHKEEHEDQQQDYDNSWN